MSLKEKYALTDAGVRTIRLGMLWTVIANLAVMAGLCILFMLMSAFVDHLVDGAPLPEARPYALALVVFFVVMLVAHWQQYTYTYGVIYRESGQQRINLAERLRKLPLSFFGRRDVADLTETILTDANTMEHVYSHVLPYLYGSFISTGLVALGLLFYDWRLMLAAFWTVPVAFALLFASRRVLNPIQLRVRELSLGVSEGIQETLECIREIRATNQEGRYLEELNRAIDEHERKTIVGEVVNGLFVQGASAVLRLGMATTILVAAVLLAQGQIGFMTMFCYLLVISRIYAPFDQSLMMMAELFASHVAAKRMASFYDEPLATGGEAFEPANHDVSFEDVSFRYNASDEAPVLSGVTFTAREGEVTALVGPSGGGKSTVSKLAARFWDAERGTVRVGGVDVSTVDPEVLLRDYAVVFQDVLLFDDTVMGNIRLGRRNATDAEVRAAARAANCDEFVERLPQGYDTVIGENGSKLSGGERQRISIARALLKDAPIVLLDEATASLDVENETQVQQALSRLLKGKTVMVIAHRMRTIENADKVVVLKEGTVVEQGAPAQLMEADGLFARMVRLQTESAAWSL